MWIVLKNLGNVIDKELTFEPVKLVKSCFLVIRNISKIKSYLTDDQLRTVISTCVFSRLDYCNSLYYGISSQRLAKLQSVQNIAARLFRRKIVVDMYHLTFTLKRVIGYM